MQGLTNDLDEEDLGTLKRYHSAGGPPKDTQNTNSQVEIDIKVDHNGQEDSNSGNTITTRKINRTILQLQISCLRTSEYH